MTTPRNRPAKTEAGRRPTTFARCRPTTDCLGAPSAGSVSWPDWLKGCCERQARDFRRDRRSATLRRAGNRGTAGWLEAGVGRQSKRRPRSLLLVVLIIIIVFILVLVVIIGESGRVVRRMALVIPELAVDAVGGEQLRMRAALDCLAARDHDD